MDPEQRIRAALRGHTPVVIGALAGVGAVLLGYLQLRRAGAAPSVVVSGGSGISAADLAAAQASGASAAIAGFTPSVDLGTAALGLAGQSVGASGDVAVALAQSQAQLGAGAQDLAAQLGTGLVSLLPQQPPVTTQPTPGTPPPAPTPFPAPPPAPAQPLPPVSSPPPSQAAPHHNAVVTVTTHLYNGSTGRWVYTLAVGTQLVVRGAGYTFGGVRTYPVVSPYAGYYVPVANVRLTS